jgi:hypothetical protein
MGFELKFSDQYKATYVVFILYTQLSYMRSYNMLLVEEARLYSTENLFGIFIPYPVSSLPFVHLCTSLNSIVFLCYIFQLRITK